MNLDIEVIFKTTISETHANHILTIQYSPRFTIAGVRIEEQSRVARYTHSRVRCPTGLFGQAGESLRGLRIFYIMKGF